MIEYLEMGTAIEAITSHLKWTGTAPAYINLSNLAFILESTKARFNSNRLPLQKKASFLLTQIVKGHPLADGNKRIAIMLLEAFVEMNDAKLNAGNDEIFDMVTSFSADRITESDIRKWLEERIR